MIVVSGLIQEDQIRHGNFEDYPTYNLDNEDEGQTLITALGKKDVFGNFQGYDWLTDVEKKNPLFNQLRSPSDMVDRLRRIESDNLEIIQLSQNIVEEINHTEAEIAK